MKKIGRYEILSKLGAGGFGIVYRARDAMLQRDIALKVLNQRLHEGDAARKRFLNEARVAAALSHPNIVVIHELGVEEGVPYIAMEYLPGADLRALIREKEPLSLRQKLNIALQTARALRHAHAHNVIHRDVKPENIRLLPSGLVKLMDFGIAKVGMGEAGGLTTSGSVLGSVSYMSPEQARGEPLTTVADIFSFGIVLYELLAYRRPFVAPNLAGLIYRILAEEPLPLEDPELPPELLEILGRCLRKSIGERYPSFDAIMQALAHLRQTVPSSSSSSQGLRLPPHPETSVASETDELSNVTASSSRLLPLEETQDLESSGAAPLSAAFFPTGVVPAEQAFAEPSEGSGSQQTGGRRRSALLRFLVAAFAVSFGLAVFTLQRWPASAPRPTARPTALTPASRTQPPLPFFSPAASATSGPRLQPAHSPPPRAAKTPAQPASRTPTQPAAKTPTPTPTATATPSAPPSPTRTLVRTPTPSTGRLRLSAPRSAFVQIDEQPEIRTPLPPLPLGPGSHRIRVRQDGFRTQEQTVVVESGKDLELRVELEPLDYGLALLLVEGPAWAYVRIDEGPEMQLPALPVRMLEGRHRARVYRPGYQTVDQVFEVVPFQQIAVPIALEIDPNAPEETDP